MIYLSVHISNILGTAKNNFEAMLSSIWARKSSQMPRKLDASLAYTFQNEWTDLSWQVEMDQHHLSFAYLFLPMYAHGEKWEMRQHSREIEIECQCFPTRRHSEEAFQ